RFPAIPVTPMCMLSCGTPGGRRGWRVEQAAPVVTMATEAAAGRPPRPPPAAGSRAPTELTPAWPFDSVRPGSLWHHDREAPGPLSVVPPPPPRPLHDWVAAAGRPGVGLVQRTAASLSGAAGVRTGPVGRGRENPDA